MLTRCIAYITAPFNALVLMLVSFKISPNTITISGLLLGIIICLQYAINGNNLLFGIGMSFCAMLDALDGTVARRMQCQTRKGAYLDAMVDRIFEVMAYFMVAYQSGYWKLCFLVAVGSYTISYAKARALMELNMAKISVGNKDWPDFMERPERLIIFFAAVILLGIFPQWHLGGYDVLFWGLCVLNILIYGTVIQRFYRAWYFLKED